jgi:hypothetical protein
MICLNWASNRLKRILFRVALFWKRKESRGGEIWWDSEIADTDFSILGKTIAAKNRAESTPFGLVAQGEMGSFASETLNSSGYGDPGSGATID